MKKLIPFITPIVLSAFIYATTPSLSRAGDPPITQVSYSTNLQNWTDLPAVDLSTAKPNPVTGQLEIFVEVEVPYTPAMDTAMFFKSMSNSMSIQYLNTPLAPPPMMISAGAGIIIAILILVVGAIIVYYLIKTAKRLLP